MTTQDMTDLPGYLNCPSCKSADIVRQEYKGGESYSCPACMRAVPLSSVALRWHGEAAEMANRCTIAETNYRSMVERAADEKLDGYRELGARAAAAENERDTLRAERDRLVAEVERLKEEREFLVTSAKCGWSSARTLSIAFAHGSGTERAADAALARLDAMTNEPKPGETK